MNVDNIKDLFCLFMNHLTSLSCELARLAIYQPREFLSVRANYGHWMLLAVKQTVESACGAGILCRKAAKRASGRSTFLKVSFLTDDLIAVTSHFHKVNRLLTRAVKKKTIHRLYQNLV